MGKVEKGVSCSVQGCAQRAVRSLPSSQVRRAGLLLAQEGVRSYLCREHYKEFKRRSRQERELERLRFGAPS
jgi:hypothetical protein